MASICEFVYFLCFEKETQKFNPILGWGGVGWGIFSAPFLFLHITSEKINFWRPKENNEIYLSFLRKWIHSIFIRYVYHLSFLHNHDQIWRIQLRENKRLCTQVVPRMNSRGFMNTLLLYKQPEKDLSLKSCLNFSRFLRSKLLKIPLILVNLTRNSRKKQNQYNF